MDVDADQDLLNDLARPLVAEFSPAEEDAELFPLLSEAHFAEPDAYANADRGTGPLAFGLPELTVLMTPVMLAAMTEVVRYVTSRAVAGGTKVTARAIRRLFGRDREVELPQNEKLALTPEQWTEVARIVERVAQQGGVPAEQAELVAYAVAGQGMAGGAAR